MGAARPCAPACPWACLGGRAVGAGRARGACLSCRTQWRALIWFEPRSSCAKPIAASFVGAQALRQSLLPQRTDSEASPAEDRPPPPPPSPHPPPPHLTLSPRTALARPGAGGCRLHAAAPSPASHAGVWPALGPPGPAQSLPTARQGTPTARRHLGGPASGLDGCPQCAAAPECWVGRAKMKQSRILLLLIWPLQSSLAFFLQSSRSGTAVHLMMYARVPNVVSEPQRPGFRSLGKRVKNTAELNLLPAAELIGEDKRVLYTAIYAAGHSLIAIPFLFFWNVEPSVKLRGAAFAFPILVLWIALLGGWIQFS